MKLHKFLLAAVAAAAFAVPMSASADIVFDFVDDNSDAVDLDATAALDGGTIGASVTIGGLTLELVDIFAPEFVDNGGATLEQNGNILRASNDDGVTTNIAGNRDRIAVNNPSISNTQFDLIDTAGGVTESSDFNTGEGFTFNLSENAVIDSIEFENLVAGNIYTVSVDGGPSQTFDGLDGNITALGALGGAEIAAGTSITIEVSGPLVDNRGGIESIGFDVVEAAAVPEPSSLLAIAGMAGLFAVRRRR